MTDQSSNTHVVPGSDRLVTPAGPAFAGVVGEPIEYTPTPYLSDDGWPLVPLTARDWATEAAGAPVNDPVTRTNQRYWYANIVPAPSGGSDGIRAEFELFLFGRRGLAVVRGATDDFIASPAGSRWRQTRWQVPVDGARVRNDHRRSAPPNTGAVGQAGPRAARAVDVVPPGIRSDFGNLPVATQRFLVEPFTDTGTHPQQVVFHAMTQGVAGRLVETLWTYLFNGRWLSFAFLQRGVPLQSPHLTGEALWTSSPEAHRLAGTPWDVAAFAAPVLKAGPAGDRLERT